MPRSYRNPPVIEAVCEFKFLETQPWDWTIPGLIYEKIGPSFPRKRQQTVLEVSVPTHSPSEIMPPTPIARMQFLREDESTLVQVWPNTLAINQLRPYGSWQAFKATILEQLAIYQKVSGQQSITRVGLRYINKLDLPSTNADLDAYL